MEITYIGHSCFRIKGKETSVVIDPYNPETLGYKLPKLEADILLISHDHDDHNFKDGVKDYSFVIDAPGECEIKGVYVQGFESYHDENKGSKRGKNVMYYLEVDGISLMHLGDLGHELSEDTLEQIPYADVLMTPIGGVYTIDSKTAVKVVASLEPGIVIPMHYQTEDLVKLKLDGLEKFLNEMGLSGEVKTLDKLKISSKSEIPEDTQVVVLEPQH